MVRRALPRGLHRRVHRADARLVLHDDGVENITLVEAEELIKQLKKTVVELKTRGVPPAPAPYRFDDDSKEFADCNPCSSGKEESEMYCGGGVGGHEFYLKHFVDLRDWLNKVLDYHRTNGCKNLKKLEKVCK